MSTEVPLILNETTVRNILTWPLVNQAVEEALKAVSAKPLSESTIVKSEANQPPRSRTDAGQNGILLTMPAYVANYKLEGNTSPSTTLSCKVVTAFGTNKPPLPAILSNVLLFSPLTGQLKCLIEGNQITAWRTASASIVSTRYLYFERFGHNAKTHPIKLAIIGCGVQGRSHALGMCATYCVSQVKLWNRTAAKAEQLAKDLSSEYENIDIKVAASAAEAVAEADVICVGTGSPTALFDYNMLTQHNVHINTVGAGKVHFGEVSQDIYDKANVYVDSWASAKVELADLKANLVAEIGEIINGLKNIENSNNRSITIFQSMGMAAEDATVAQAVLDAHNGKKQ